MKNNHNSYTLLLSFIGMGIMILDTPTVITGAKEGVDLCIQVVIPALFPFFLLSKLLTVSAFGWTPRILKPICKLCGIPMECSFLLILSLLGGYPVGAQAIIQCYHDGNISKAQAIRLIGFCNNAGPSFIFGMLSGLFTSPNIIWYVWLVHILASLSVGIVLPGKTTDALGLNKEHRISVPQAIEQSIKSIATVSGWVIIFRVLIALAGRWIFPLLPDSFHIVILGLLELTNACCELHNHAQENMRFIFACVFLAWGSFCVLMQTNSVTKDLGLGMYIPGKALQTLFSILFSCILERLLFKQYIPVPIIVPAIAIMISLIILFIIHKKSSSFMKNCVV